jgi:hypothetical protein
MQDRDTGRRGLPAGRSRTAVKPEVANKVKEWARARLSPQERAGSNLYIDPDVLDPGSVLGPAFQQVIIKRPSVLVFQDDDPRANFGHRCSWLLFDAENGDPLHQIPSQAPPYNFKEFDRLAIYYEAVKPRDLVAHGLASDAAPRSALAAGAPTPSAAEGCGEGPVVGAAKASPQAPPAATSQRFAILFAGDCNKRHVNDLELSYRMLQKYGFKPENIRVLLADGRTDGPLFQDPDDQTKIRHWPGSPHDDPTFHIKVDARGTREKLHDALIEIGTLMGANDTLFIHTEGHGYHEDGDLNENAFLAGFSPVIENAQYFARDLKNDLASFPNPYGSLIVLMNQCFADAFTDSILSGANGKAAKTFISCGSHADQTTHATNDQKWCYFSLNWMQAMVDHLIGDGPPPLPSEPEKNADGTIPVLSAFQWANKATIPHVPERPVSGESSTAAEVITLI